MSVYDNKHPGWNDQFKRSNQRDLKVQVVVSVVFGLSAFLSFCVSQQPCSLSLPDFSFWF